MAIQQAKTEKNFIKRRFVKKIEVLTFYKSTVFSVTTEYTRPSDKSFKLSGAGALHR